MRIVSYYNHSVKKYFEYFSVFVSELGFIEQKTMQKLKQNFRDVTITILYLPSAASSQKLVGITRDFDLAAFFAADHHKMSIHISLA